MKRLLMLGVALAALTAGAPAIAADLSLKAPPAPPVAPSWGGFYLGGHVGWGWADGTNSVADPNPGTIGFGFGFGTMSPTNDNKGDVRAGLLVGYNWQATPNWMLGIEGDWSSGQMHAGGTTGLITSGGHFPISSGFATTRTDINDIGTIRARLGYTTPDWMLYATGGAAFAAVDYSGDFGCTGDPVCAFPVHAPVAFSRTKLGYTVGAGVEHRLLGGWIIGAEYLFYHFDGETASGVPVTIPGGAPFTFGGCSPGAACVGYAFGAEDIHTVRGRLSYKFN